MKTLTFRIGIALFTFVIGISIATAWVFQSPTIDPVDTGKVESSEDTAGDVASKSTLEMVFVLDTTGSMGGLLEGAKQRIWGIVNEVMQSPSHPSVRIGLVAYRDHGDQYVSQVVTLTNDLDKVYSNLMASELCAGG